VIDPRHPALLAPGPDLPTIAFPIEARSVAVRNNIAYVATVNFAFTPLYRTVAVNISTPAAPAIVNSFSTLSILNLGVQGKSLVTVAGTSYTKPILGVFDTTAASFTPQQQLEITHGATWIPVDIGFSGDVAIIPGPLGAFSDIRLFFVKFQLVP
jgi:hypothetical protein